MTHDEMVGRMCRLIADSLAVKLEDVRPSSRLLDDLGADSLDFLDIVFSIEREFGIKLRDSELDFLSRLDFSSPEVMRDGRLTTATLERVRPWLPRLRDLVDAEGVTPGQLFSAIDVLALCNVVERKLA